jgi:hypothetical protein
MSVAVGSRLGPYDILAPIGAGGMGEVFRARDTRLDRLVAIKISHENFSERVEYEARAIAALNHPNICQIYDVGPNYLVMEYIEGESVHTKNQIRAKESNLSASCEKRWNRIARATDLTRAKGRLRGRYFQDLGFPIEDVKRPGVRNGDANRQARGTLPPSLRSNPAFAAIPARLCRAIDECANCGSSERRL